MDAAALLAERERLATEVWPPSAARREALSEATDRWVSALAALAGIDAVGGVLVAVGGYGRRQLSPRSDLDLVLLHPNSASAANVAEVADRIWYPIWDSGVALDHAVRTLPETRKLATGDLKVVFGLLDARPLVGDAQLAANVKASVLGDWRAMAPSRLPDLHAAVRERTARVHELAHLLEPDLKESYGGLRDVTLLRAIAASWVTDYPHDSVGSAAEFLSDVRDALQLVAGRATNRLAMQEQAAVAELLGRASDDELLREVIDAGRVIAYAADLTWHRVERLTRKQPAFRRLRSRPSDERIPLAAGVVSQSGEVFLAKDARPDRDPVLLLRAAAAAAQADLRLAPETITRFANARAEIPQPWPRAAREALVSLLGAGSSTVPVWEALEHVGLLSEALPHWRHVRSLPQRNALHRFTVDRHQLETAVAAAALTRTVHRPDLLLVAALFHDIGKGRGPDHCGTGATLMADIAPRLGFGPADAEVLCTLVRHHLLLAETATSRDLDDPTTVEAVAAAVGSAETLELLHALTEADSIATGSGLWSSWKRQLLQELVDRVHAALAGRAPEEPTSLAEAYPQLLGGERVFVEMHVLDDGVRVIVGTDDRPGLLATVAGVMTVHRLEVRAATVETVDDRALQSWLVVPEFGDPPTSEQLLAELRHAITGNGDIDAKVRARTSRAPQRRGFVAPPPRVNFVLNASERADVLEVRAHDEPALLWRVGHVIAQVGMTVLSARVSTLGSEAIDVLYVCRVDGSRLTADDCELLAQAVGKAIGAAG